MKENFSHCRISLFEKGATIWQKRVDIYAAPAGLNIQSQSQTVAILVEEQVFLPIGIVTNKARVFSP